MIEKMLQILISLLQRWQNRESLKLFGARRSSQWGKVRNEHLEHNPKCAICGAIKGVQVHHKKPFHKFPELELEPTNLISLCDEKGCHLRFGHLYNFSSYNENIEDDAEMWRLKIKNRP